MEGFQGPLARWNSPPARLFEGPAISLHRIIPATGNPPGGGGKKRPAGFVQNLEIPYTVSMASTRRAII
jgi:hypothetical protein